MHEAFFNKKGSVNKMKCNNDFVYVLFNDKSIEMFDAGNMMNDTIAGAKGDFNDIAIVGGELWAGSNDGLIYAFDAKTLAPVAGHEGV